MNIRRVILIVPCILSIIGLFLVCFSLELNGEPVDGCTLKLISSWYGIVILIADAVVILSCLAGIKKGFVIGSLVSIGVTLYSLYKASLAETAGSLSFQAVNKMLGAYSDGATAIKYELVHGPAYFMLIFASIIIFVTMIWNALSRED